MFQGERSEARYSNAEALPLWLSSSIEDKTVERINYTTLATSATLATFETLETLVTSETVKNANVRIVNVDEKLRKRREINRKYYEKRKVLSGKAIGNNFLHPQQMKSERNRKYYQKNKKNLCEKAAQFRRLHQEQVIEYARQYRVLNREEINRSACEYRVSNREELYGYARQYRVLNREEITERAREYRLSNREEITDRAREYRLSNREEITDRAREYRVSNRKEITERAREYRAWNREEIRERNKFYDVTTFLQDIKKGPTNVCVSCGRLFFDRSMSVLRYSQVLKPNHNITVEFIKNACPLIVSNSNVLENDDDIDFMDDNDIENDDELGLVCSNCKLYLLKGKVPPLSLSHSELRFPEIPPELQELNRLEERFLAPRIGFIQITASHVDQQLKSKGRIVNVPTDPATSVNILPRNYSNLGVIMVKLKKRKCYKRNEIVSNIRPAVILRAAAVLANSEVYREEKIQINSSDLEDIVIDTRNKLIDDCNSDSEPDSDLDIVDVSCDSFSESDNEDDTRNNSVDESSNENNGPEKYFDEETCLLTNEGLIFAPGENNSPLSILRDVYAASCTFIKIYAGTLRRIPKHLTHQKVLQSEISRYDRRCCDPYRLMYAALELRTHKMLSSILLCMRKSRNLNNITAGQLLNDGFVNNLTLKDVAYKVFEHDRGSPAFFAKKKKEMFAMIRQIGPAAIFLTLSSAETKWLELLVILKNTVDKEIITESEAASLPYHERTRLLSADPVTAAKYFEHKLKCIFKLLVQKKKCIFGKYYVVDYYIRIEFQFRGSPHAHILLWFNEAPVYFPDDIGSRIECELFNDELITCEKMDISVLPAVQYQVHKHSRTCKRKVGKSFVCRFHVPWFPIDKTSILEPLRDDEFDETCLENIKNNYEHVRTELAKMYKDPPEMTFDEFLTKINLSKDDYYTVLRYSIAKSTVFIKREVNAIRVNAYNAKILELFHANMDIQFITDVYSCVNYILNYLCKSRGELSKLLYEICKEITKGMGSI